MDNNYILGPDGELYHWGIKGMKWGVRRYQNKDGSLTAAGKARTKENDSYGLDKHDLKDGDVQKFYEEKTKIAYKQVDSDFANPEEREVHRKWANDMTDAYMKHILNTNKDDYVRLKDEYIKLAFDNPEAKKADDCRNNFIYSQASDRLKKTLDNAKANAYSIEWAVDKDGTSREHDVLWAAYDTAYNAMFFDMSDINHSDISEDDLYHWGIKGMKWGIRRYQNKDGSLTPAGKKRYAKLEAEMEKLGGKSQEKKMSEMTDDEVAAKTNRMRLENNLKEEMRKSAEAEQRQRKLQESLDETSTEELRNKVARLQLEEQYKNLKNPKKTERDPQMEKLQKEVDKLALEKRYRDLQNELHPKKKSFVEKFGEKAVNEVLVPAAMNAGKSYLDKMVTKHVKGSEPTINDLLKKYGDMSDADYERYKRAAAVKGWEQNILGKKTKDK